MLSSATLTLRTADRNRFNATLILHVHRVRMSIIVSVKINDGIVMAADSATTFTWPDGKPGQIYEHAIKIVNLIKGAPVGVMTCESGGIGNASIATRRYGVVHG
jgi:hypothetical protein